MKNCGVCGITASNDMLETHHIKPRHLNGSDDPANLIDICSNCHSATHKLAFILKRDSQSAAGFLELNYPGQTRAQQLLVDMAKTIIVEGEKELKKDFVNVSYRPEEPVHRKLKDMARQSKINMHDFLTYLIEKEWRLRHNGIKVNKQ